MSQFTQAWVDAQNAKLRPKAKKTDGAFDGKESDLHDEILRFCALRHWLVRRDRMDKKSTGNVGWPDMTIFADGKVFVAEVKNKRGVVSPQQNATINALKALGHKAGIVWSMNDFLELIQQ